MPRVEDAHCPFPACPCDASGRALCESLEAGTLAIPGGNTTTLAQIRRQPLDVVLSAFLYHRWGEVAGQHSRLGRQRTCPADGLAACVLCCLRPHLQASPICPLPVPHRLDFGMQAGAGT